MEPVNFSDFVRKFDVATGGSLAQRKHQKSVVFLFKPNPGGSNPNSKKHALYCKFALVRFKPWMHRDIPELMNESTAVIRFNDFVSNCSDELRATFQFDFEMRSVLNSALLEVDALQRRMNLNADFDLNNLNNDDGGNDSEDQAWYDDSDDEGVNNQERRQARIDDNAMFGILGRIGRGGAGESDDDASEENDLPIDSSFDWHSESQISYDMSPTSPFSKEAATLWLKQQMGDYRYAIGQAPITPTDPAILNERQEIVYNFFEAGMRCGKQVMATMLGPAGAVSYFIYFS